MAHPNKPTPRLGLRENWQQFTLLVVVNAFVGGMIGLERTVIPLIADIDFGLVSRTVILSFIISFGVVKAFANLIAGTLGDGIGRKKLLIGGWFIGLPVPFILMWAPQWEWIVLANILLGINQGLCWSTTVIMKIDLVGPKQRGLAMGLNEFAGYAAVSVSAFATGYIASAYALRPQPFYLGVMFAFLGLLISAFLIRDTREHVRLESLLREQSQVEEPPEPASTAKVSEKQPTFAEIVLITSWRDRTLFAVSQAGMVNNLNDGMVWGLLPLFLAGAGLSIARIGIVAAVYPGVWGVSQLATGAVSDRVGRKWMIAAGLWVQAAGMLLLLSAGSFQVWAVSAAIMGLGTAMVYPTLLAAVSDVAHPTWRGSAVGVYRLWRDGGYAAGALLAGILADTLGLEWAIAAIALATATSGMIVAVVMYETIPTRQMA